MAACFLFRSGGRRLVADSLLRPRPVAVPGTLLQAAPLPPTHGALLRPFLNSRLASSSSTPPPPPQNEAASISSDSKLRMRKMVNEYHYLKDEQMTMLKNMAYKLPASPLPHLPPRPLTPPPQVSTDKVKNWAVVFGAMTLVSGVGWFVLAGSEGGQKTSVQ